MLRLTLATLVRTGGTLRRAGSSRPMPYGKGLLEALDTFAWAEMFAALKHERLGRGTWAVEPEGFNAEIVRSEFAIVTSLEVVDEFGKEVISTESRSTLSSLQSSPRSPLNPSLGEKARARQSSGATKNCLAQHAGKRSEV